MDSVEPMFVNAKPVLEDDGNGKQKVILSLSRFSFFMYSKLYSSALVFTIVV